MALGVQNLLKNFLSRNKENQAQLPHPGSFSSGLSFFLWLFLPWVVGSGLRNLTELQKDLALAPRLPDNLAAIPFFLLCPYRRPVLKSPGCRRTGNTEDRNCVTDIFTRVRELTTASPARVQHLQHSWDPPPGAVFSLLPTLGCSPSLPQLGDNSRGANAVTLHGALPAAQPGPEGALPCRTPQHSAHQPALFLLSFMKEQQNCPKA